VPSYSPLPGAYISPQRKSRNRLDLNGQSLFHAQKKTPAGKEEANIACLRGLRALAIPLTIRHPSQRNGKPYAFSYPFDWWAHTNEHDIIGNPFDLILAGKYKKDKHIMMGILRDEGGFYSLANTVRLKLHENTKNKMNILYDQAFGPVKRKLVEAKYPIGEKEYDNETSYARLMSDYIFICPSMAVANNIAAANRKEPTNGKLYIYHFTRVPKYLKVLPGRCKTDFVCHAFDIPFFWRPWFVKMSKTERAISRNYLKYFMGFIQGGVNFHAYTDAKNPVIWPIYEGQTRSVMEFNKKLNIQTGVRERECSLWNDKLHYVF